MRKGGRVLFCLTPRPQAYPAAQCSTDTALGILKAQKEPPWHNKAQHQEKVTLLHEMNAEQLVR